MLNIEIPEAPITLKGFPTCAHPHNDGREVEKAGDLCALDGGKPASLEIIRRSLHRQIQQSLRQFLACEKCRAIPPNDIRCNLCSWFRGAIMGMAGIGEQVWGEAEFESYLKIVSVFDPGWQERVEWK
jgi:hypothetical protein